MKRAVNTIFSNNSFSSALRRGNSSLRITRCLRLIQKKIVRLKLSRNHGNNHTKFQVNPSVDFTYEHRFFRFFFSPKMQKFSHPVLLGFLFYFPQGRTFIACLELVATCSSSSCLFYVSLSLSFLIAVVRVTFRILFRILFPKIFSFVSFLKHFTKSFVVLSRHKLAHLSHEES